MARILPEPGQGESTRVKGVAMDGSLRERNMHGLRKSTSTSTSTTRRAEREGGREMLGSDERRETRREMRADSEARERPRRTCLRF